MKTDKDKNSQNEISKHNSKNIPQIDENPQIARRIY